MKRMALAVAAILLSTASFDAVLAVEQAGVTAAVLEGQSKTYGVDIVIGENTRQRAPD